MSEKDKKKGKTTPKQAKNKQKRRVLEADPPHKTAPKQAEKPVPEASPSPSPGLHPAEQYAQDVLDGKIVVCKWVRKAVERHRRDLATAEKRGLKFDPAAGDRIIRFFLHLKHSKGEWARKPFTLEPWQQFCLWVIFGWKKADGMRRFRLAYKKVARKNGKSTELAGVGIYLFAADGEEGADVYSAATKKDQARIIHGEAVAMVRASPELSRYITIFKDNLHIVASRSKFEPLGADEDTTDGLHVHGAIIDELHAHKNRGMFDVLDSGTGARRQPLIFVITTAGAGRLGVDQEMHTYAEKVLDGIIEDDSFFAIMYMIDPEDDWRDERCWIKANPNLGISVKVDDLRAKCRKAIEMPSAQNEFLRKHMNRQTDQVTLWLPMDKWLACAGKVEDSVLYGRRCFVGLDLSSKLDITAQALVFPPCEEDAKWRVKIRLYVPEETAAAREKVARVPYETWGKQGFLTLTPGNVIDYEFIKADVFESARNFEVVEIAYDPWSATQIALQLQQESLTCVEVGQGFRSLSEPTKELEKLVTSLGVGHDGNPVLDWMASNVSVETDPAGNIKPSKKHSSEKIDGVAAIVTAMARAMLSLDDDGGYEDGVFFT